MRVAVAADHAGYALKELLRAHLVSRGHAMVDHYSAHQGVEHDAMNVLALGACVIGDALALEIADAFLAAHFDGKERHRRRIEKVRALEARFAREPHRG